MLEKTSLPQTVILAQADLVNAKKALDDLLNSKLQQAKAQQAVEQAQQAENSDPEQARAAAANALASAQKVLENAHGRCATANLRRGRAISMKPRRKSPC